MQLLANCQVDLMFQELTAKPEVQQLLSDTAAFREMSEGYADILDHLPDRVAEVGNATISQVMRELESREGLVRGCSPS